MITAEEAIKMSQTRSALINVNWEIHVSKVIDRYIANATKYGRRQVTIKIGRKSFFLYADKIRINDLEKNGFKVHMSYSGDNPRDCMYFVDGEMTISW